MGPDPFFGAEVSLLERLFELAFKYRPLVFQQGDLAFSPPWPVSVVVLAVLTAALGAGIVSRRSRLESRAPVRGVLLALRLAALACLLFCLLRPVLVVRAVEPQRNFLAVLVDDSRSMTLADDNGAARSAFVTASLAPSSALREALARRFSLRFFNFSSSIHRTPDPASATYTGTRSLIGQAARQAAEELSGLPVSGIVLVTDGADTSRLPMADTIRALKATGLPVFAVGLGRESFARDVQLGRVDPPTRALKGATLVVDAVVGQSGYAGRKVPLVVEDEGQQLASQEITLPADNEPATVRVRFTLAEPGPRVIQFRIPVLDGEQVSQNNVRQALITVDDRRERVLYIEGEPRYEMKFLRQAVADDPNLQLVTLQRTASRKFLRLDINESEELAGGFPKTRDELFAYRGIVLGSIEASAFTDDQLRMMADFVNVRGGGLLALGGRRAFAEGGYAGTAVGEALPVVLDSMRAADTFLERVQVRPTRQGQTHVVTQVAETEQASMERWPTLPMLTTVNPIRRVKPGAVLLLAGADGSHDQQVVLAYQRYGAGKSFALPVQDTWTWQMHASMSVEDQTHETLWRRLIRWLVDNVPERVAASVEHDRVERGDTVSVAAFVRDGGYLGINDATVRVHVTGPDGRAQDIPMAFAVDRDGEYRARFTADRDGTYEIRADAMRGKVPAGSARAFVRVGPDDGEYFDAMMRAPLLRRIAGDTGGRFYTPSDVARMPEDITYLGRGVTVVQELDLWDMPVLLLLIVGLVGGEWLLRRRRGLA
jgi:uncharacterized membrane protein